MPIQKLTIQLTGVSPILMHSGQTADPLNHYSKALKAISSKRSKTDADHEEMSKIEWFASLYLNKQQQVILPDFLLESAFINGAKKSKLGKQAQAGLFIENHATLDFDGQDLSPDELFERGENLHRKAVRVQQNKVMRTRFIAEQWGAKINLVYNDTLLNEAQVIRAIEDCGEQVGLCDWRPKYGRFLVEKV